VGFALSTVAGLGLLIERSPDLTADIGRQEMLVGLSFVVAPAIGMSLLSYSSNRSTAQSLWLAGFLPAPLRS